MFNNLKYFRLFGGLSFRKPDLITDQTVATDTRNVMLSEQFALTKRRGYHYSLTGVGGSGIFTYNNVNVGSGTATVERLVADSTLHKLSEVPIEIYIDSAYGGALPNWTVDIHLDKNTATFKFYIKEDGVVVFEQDLGTGLEIAPYTINDLVADVANTPFYRIATASSSFPAAFIPPVYELAGAPVEPPTYSRSSAFHAYRKSEAIPSVPIYDGDEDPEFVPFANHFAEKGNPDWELITSVQAHDVIYFTNKDDGLMKYDGEKIYKAGLPVPFLSADEEDPEALDNRNYMVLYRYTDAKGNVTTSRVSNIISVDSSEVTVNLTVTLGDGAGNGLNTGYDGANVSVEVYRTIENGTVFYLVESRNPTPTELLNMSMLFQDTMTDEDLRLQPSHTFTEREGDEPPKCAYIDMWRDNIVLTGNPDSVNTVYIADPEHIEGFDLRNSVLTMSKWGGANTGLRQLGNQLFVFKARSINRITGDISQGALGVQVDTISDNGIGSLSHGSVVEALGRLYFLSVNGICSLDEAGVQNESEDLTPIFSRYTFKENRALSFYWVNENKILFLLPEYDSFGFEMRSRVLVRDLIVNEWYVWDNLDFSSGISDDRQKIWFQGTHITDLLQDNRTEDYADHTVATPFVYKTHWEALDDPSIPKKFNRIKVFSKDNELKTFDSSSFSLTVETNHNLSEAVVSSLVMDFGDPLNSGWGLSAWGEDSYGDIKEVSNTRRLAAHKANLLRVVFSNDNIHENVLISGFELEVSTPYKPGLREGV